MFGQDCHQEGVTVDRKCDSHQRDVKGIRKMCQLTERCNGYRGGVRRCGEVTVVKRCDSPKEVCQLVGRCYGHGDR